MARSVSGASAAAAVPATASPSGADRSGSVTVRVLFRRAGALGLDFTIDGNQSVVADRIAPGSVAAAEPRLSEGLRLVEVQGRRTHHMEAKDALDILKRYAADRPLAWRWLLLLNRVCLCIHRVSALSIFELQSVAIAKHNRDEGSKLRSSTVGSAADHRSAAARRLPAGAGGWAGGW